MIADRIGYMGLLAMRIGLGCALAPAGVRGAEYFVSPGGSDLNPGTLQHPFASLQKAAETVKPGDTCFLREGVYRETLRPAQSGRAGAVITFARYRHENAVISGADPIAGWKHEGDGLYSAPMPWSLDDGNQVFADGNMLTEACWPNAGAKPLYQPERATASGGSESTLACTHIPGPAEAWIGAQLWCAGGSSWICWTATVTAYDETTGTLTFDTPQKRWYIPKAGNRFVLRGVRHALDAPGEWLYDASRRQLLLIPPDGGDLKTTGIEAKRRLDVIDLSGRSHIHIEGISFHAGGIRTDADSAHITLNNLKGRYVAHSYSKDVSTQAGVLLFGKDILLLNADLDYSSASVLTVRGEDHRIINCHIRHGGYAGLWKGTVTLSGRRILFSHNTVRHAGRDLVNTHGLMESLVQYNDVSDAGWLTKDLGMFYGHNTDFAGTQFCYNWVHDNHAEDHGQGIYFDHLSHNAIVHHNVIWNVAMDPIRINNPSYGNLVFNNSCWNTGETKTFDHAKRNDLFASRYVDNIFNMSIRLPDSVFLENNLIAQTPPFRDPVHGDFRLSETAGTHAGAYPPGAAPWRAGCDLENPPDPLPVYKAAAFPWMNAVRNACFEFGTLESWQMTDAAKAELTEGNGWGNDSDMGLLHKTGTSRHELRLGPGRDGVKQVVDGLEPDTTYTLSAWVRVSDTNETIVLRVREDGNPPVSASLSSVEWTRLDVTFTTGPDTTQAVIHLLKSSEGAGYAWGDNITLPRAPRPSVKAPIPATP